MRMKMSLFFQQSIPIFSVAILGFSSACRQTTFNGKSGAAPAKPAPVKGTPGVDQSIPSKNPGEEKRSPIEGDANLQRPAKNPSVECGRTHKAVRLALVVDTSLSMGASTCASGPLVPTRNPDGSSILELTGSDPARIGTTVRGKSECYTDRQNAVYSIIKRTADRDAEALKVNPTFIGSEVGIAHFPSGANGTASNTYGKISENAPLKKAMTNLSGEVINETFLNGVWGLLDKTHQMFSQGTPYLAAISAGKDLLKTGRDPNDPRRDLLLLITDGLPTDQRPSLVKAARAELSDVDLIFVYMFDPLVAEAVRNEEARSKLKEAFDGQFAWARNPGNTDGYGIGDFEKYWQDLIKLPAEIYTARVDVNEPGRLTQQLEKILEVVQKCE
jgi:hypothetical protein